MLVVVVELNHTLYEHNSLLMEITICCSCMFTINALFCK